MARSIERRSTAALRGARAERPSTAQKTGSAAPGRMGTRFGAAVQPLSPKMSTAGRDKPAPQAAQGSGARRQWRIGMHQPVRT